MTGLLSWLLCALAALCISLSWPRHWRQFFAAPIRAGQQRLLRIAGSVLVLLALWVCIQNDVVSFALWQWVLQTSLVFALCGVVLGLPKFERKR